jgi:hypothetical protein
MTRRGWLYVASGGLLVLSTPLALRCAVLARGKPKPDARQVEEQLVQWVNDARKQHLNEVRPGPEKLYAPQALTDVARDLADKWAAEKDDKLPSEQWLLEKLRSSGYADQVMRFAVRGGVVYKGPEGGRSLREAFDKWVSDDLAMSPPETRSILNPYISDIGAGVAVDDVTGAYFVALVFGKRFMNMKMPKKDTAPESNPNQ